jgi:signal transduction histidine kinase/Flp pilus assembly protein TadD
MITNKREEIELEGLYKGAQMVMTKRDTDDSLKSLNELLRVAKQYNSLKYLGSGYALKGYLYYGINEVKLAINCFETSLDFFSKKTDVFYDEIKQSKNSLGALYKNIGEFKSALRALFDSVEISEEYLIPNSIAYNNIANIYAVQEDYKKALSYFQLAIERENEVENSNRSQVVKYLTNIAVLHTKIGNFDEADEIYRKTLDYCEENNEFETLVQSLSGLSIVLLEKKEYENAEIFLNRAVSLSQKISYNVYLVDISLYLAEIYEHTKKPSQQIASLNYALRIAQESRKTKEMLVLENIHDYYFKNGNINEAYETLKKMFILNKKLFLKEKEENILEMQEKFESEQKDKLIKQEKEFSETLKHKNLELAELNDDLAQFNHGVSHDLKEPIRLVKGRLTYLQSLASSKLDLQELGSLDIAQAAAERMEKMLEDLHKFSTLGGNLKDAKEVDLNEVLAIVQADLQMRIRENNAEVEVGKLPVVQGYKSMYVQLFQNLTNNALKFRKEGMPPVIKITHHEDKLWHIIDIEDNGVGIKPENLEEVFKLFKRLKETDYKEGSGVGLSIVQKIAKKMQGEISLASIYGSGTTFTLKLPKYS